MTYENTTRRTLPIIDMPVLRHETLYDGNRYRCSTCLMEGRESEPTYLCHHCGHLFCEACAPKRSWWQRLLFQHQEFKWLGQQSNVRRWPWQRWKEAAHCGEHTHPIPRLAPWILIGTFGALLIFFIFSLLNFDPMFIALATVIPLLLWVTVGFAWRFWDRKRVQKLFFPVDAAPPLLSLLEFFKAAAILDGRYQEQVEEGMPRGYLKATIPLQPVMIEGVEKMARAHQLNEIQLGETAGSAGAVLIRNSSRVVNANMRWSDTGMPLTTSAPPWPHEGARRWDLTAPLIKWSYLWTGKGEHKQELTFPYKIDWWKKRGFYTSAFAKKDYRYPFPVQVQAYFLEQDERRILQLSFVLSSQLPVSTTNIKKVILKEGDGLPPFTLQEVPNGAMIESTVDNIQVSEMDFDVEHIASLQLRFKRPPLEGQHEKAWLTGVILIEAPVTMSGAEIEAYYDPFGQRPHVLKTKSSSKISLKFKINVASLPYERLSRYQEELILKGINAERDDQIISSLATQSHLIRISEQEHLTQGKNTPRREIMGRWPVEHEYDSSLPVIFHIELTPTDTKTQLDLRVEAPVHDNTLEQVRAIEYGHRLRKLIQQVDEAFWQDWQPKKSKSFYEETEDHPFGDEPKLWPRTSNGK